MHYSPGELDGFNITNLIINGRRYLALFNTISPKWHLCFALINVFTVHKWWPQKVPINMLECTGSTNNLNTWKDINGLMNPVGNILLYKFWSRVLVFHHSHSTWASWRHHQHHDCSFNSQRFPRYWPFVRGIYRSPMDSPKKASDVELWCLLWSAPEQTIEQTIETPVNEDVIALIMTIITSLLCTPVGCRIHQTWSVRIFGLHVLAEK